MLHVSNICLRILLVTAIGSLPVSAQESPPPTEQIQADADAAFLKAFLDPNLADGFDFPVGDINGKGSYSSPAGKKFTG